jgi:protoporphyrin/coproporphyrin ferrochelatase
LSRIAVVLFNLGGPDSLAAVRPFLFNLFRDKAIINVPAMLRYPLAALISSRREKGAQANYARMGGASPLLPETIKQAKALEVELGQIHPVDDVKVFVAMRYWSPLTAETAKDVEGFAPDELILLPLYPQFSTTTTQSSLSAWLSTYRGSGRSREVCCYPTVQGVIQAQAHAIREAWAKGGKPENIRLLFSAHGLPEKVITGGDPYQAQVQATAAAVAGLLPEFTDWSICYQSRVGPLKWLGPSTEIEIRRAGAEGKGVLICPIAFVSEHIETLVELDHEYAEVATQVGCSPYLRAAALGCDAGFISGLAQAVSRALRRTSGSAPDGDWVCPMLHGQCPRTPS